jgi:hypothetical protein
MGLGQIGVRGRDRVDRLDKGTGPHPRVHRDEVLCGDLLRASIGNNRRSLDAIRRLP